MDLATILSMMGQGSGAAASAPAAMPGAAQMGGQAMQMPGFNPAPGMGGMLDAGMNMGQQNAMQAAPGGLAGMMGGLEQFGQDPQNMQRMMQLAQMMQARGGQQQAAQPIPMMQMGRQAGVQNNTQAARGYLAQGGGIASPQVARGY